MATKVVSAHTLDPSGPFWTRFGVFYGKIKMSQQLIKVPEKTSKMSPGLAGAAYGVPNKNFLEKLSIKVHCTQKSIYSIPMHLKLILSP